MESRNYYGERVAIGFTATVDEVAKVTRFQLMRILHWKVWYGVAALFIVWGILLLVFASRPGAGVTPLWLGVFWFFYLAVLTRLISRWEARKSVRKEPSRWMEFSDDGVRLGTALRDELTRWFAFSEVIIWDGVYLLRLKKTKLYAFVPRRAFLSEDDEQEFREIASRHVKVHAPRGARAYHAPPTGIRARTQVPSGYPPRQWPPPGSRCLQCGNGLVATAAFCHGCGASIWGAADGHRRSRKTAVLLAVFFSFWTFLYTYDTSRWKFWLGAGLTIPLLVAALIVNGIVSNHTGIAAVWVLVSFCVWVWAIIDRSTQPL